MALDKEILSVLDEALGLRGRSAHFQRHTPELDSMAVLSVITLLEERFGFTIHDDEIDGAVFATVGSLIDFVGAKTGTT